jgi:ectoine hydroxylase
MGGDLDRYALSEAQLRDYERDGFLFLPQVFSADEVAIMRGELPHLYAENSPRRVLEKDGHSVRSLFAPHTSNDVFRRVACDPRVLCKAQQLVRNDVYIYQYKINAKVGFSGDVWAWHQDYIYWWKEDGLPTPAVTSAVVFLDDVTEFNGPMFLIPGSHGGCVDVAAGGLATTHERRGPYAGAPSWMANLVADIKYTLDRDTVASMIRERGMVAPKGPAGSMVFFHSNTVHGSPQNISPFDRTIAIVSYASVDNIPTQPGEPRPDFIVGRDRAPLRPIGDGKPLGT